MLIYYIQYIYIYLYHNIVIYNKEYFTYTMSMPVSVAMTMSMPVSVAMTMCMTPLRYGGEREKKHSVHCHGPCCISSSSPMTICLRSLNTRQSQAQLIFRYSTCSFISLGVFQLNNSKLGMA